jgi:hypothetical protein
LKSYETIIIGGGISGLACARTLYDNKKDFLLITKNIGGRTLTSKSHKVDYGASYITTEYKHALKFIDKGDRLAMQDIYFIQQDIIATVFHPKNLIHFPKLMKVAYLVNDFAKRLAKFRERSLIIGQKKALKEDEVLKNYTKMPAKEFIKKYKIEYLHDIFFDPLLQSTVYTELERSNTFYYLGVLIPIVRKTYAADFSHMNAKITKGYEDKIKYDEVVSLKKNKKNQYIVKTKKKEYVSDHVVIATPYTYARKFYPVKKTGPIVSVFVIHVKGEREEVYQKKKVVFFKPKYHDITILWKQPSGGDIIFSKVPNPNLKKYYKSYRVIKRTYWKNALMLSGSVNNWVDQKLDKKLYLASDYNVCGLEDSFITGVYAANQIIKSK